MEQIIGMVWDANTDLLTYNAKDQEAEKFINAVYLNKKVSKGKRTSGYGWVTCSSSCHSLLNTLAYLPL